MSRGESFLFNRSTITDCLKSLQDNGWRIAMDSKKSVGVKTFWYTDMLVMPKLVTIGLFSKEEILSLLNR